jgi:hypothetical protein
MTDKLISYQTAKLAKEKGFDWTSDYAFGTFDGLYERRVLRCKHEMHPSRWKNDTEKISAPTQSLLQRWVWETHSIWVQSTPIFTANECIGVSVTISSWRFPVINVNYVGFDVYDGLENGLFEALKLI